MIWYRWVWPQKGAGGEGFDGRCRVPIGASKCASGVYRGAFSRLNATRSNCHLIDDNVVEDEGLRSGPMMSSKVAKAADNAVVSSARPLTANGEGHLPLFRRAMTAEFFGDVGETFVACSGERTAAERIGDVGVDLAVLE